VLAGESLGDPEVRLRPVHGLGRGAPVLPDGGAEPGHLGPTHPVQHRQEGADFVVVGIEDDTHPPGCHGGRDPALGEPAAERVRARRHAQEGALLVLLLNRGGELRFHSGRRSLAAGGNHTRRQGTLCNGGGRQRRTGVR
jgi:hypothetical protein